MSAIDLRARLARLPGGPACASAPLGRTLTDVSNFHNVQDAKHELDRCVTDADFAAWSRKWGEAFVSVALNRKH